MLHKLMGILFFPTQSCFVWGWGICFVVPGRQLGGGKPTNREHSGRGEERGAFVKALEKS